MDEVIKLIHEIAASNPICTIDYESDWSEVTPGDGPLEGCRYCLSTYATKESGHNNNCFWERAKIIAGV